jgi:hypothetical protein
VPALECEREQGRDCDGGENDSRDGAQGKLAQTRNRRGRRLRGSVQGGVVGEDRPLEIRQLAAGIDPELSTSVLRASR